MGKGASRGWKFLTAVAALALGGCAAGGVAMQAEINSLRDRCNFENDARFAALKGKIPLSPEGLETPPTLIELSNQAKPTQSEKAAIFSYDVEASKCANDALRIATRAGNSSVVGLFSEARIASQNLLRRLAEGQITYGQYRSNSFQLLANAQKSLGDYARAQQVADAQSRQAAAAEMAASSQSRPKICTRVWESVICN